MIASPVLTNETTRKGEDMESNSSSRIATEEDGDETISLRTGWRGMSINITPAERFGRIFLGGLGAVAGAVLLASAASAFGVVLEVLLVAAGVDLVVTGALGHCPLYAKLGHVPASLRRSS
jgi:Protein of unknown function (DUF2892)